MLAVKCFGTEDRKQENPIPATDRVYDYIIFRGTDIKDLHVCEKPAAPAPQQYPQDPAIVNVRSTTRGHEGERGREVVVGCMMMTRWDWIFLCSDNCVSGYLYSDSCFSDTCVGLSEAAGRGG